MGSILPGVTREKAESIGITRGQYDIIVVEHYMLIGLYTLLFALVIVNIWTILVKQRRYKTLPLFAFYIFTFFAITLRLIYLIMAFSPHNLALQGINDLFLTSKLCVGLIQSWMIFEIALRVRQTYKSNYCQSAGSESFENWVRCGQYSTIAASIASIFAITIEDLLTMKDWKDENLDQQDIRFNAFAFSFLGMFLLTASVNVVLICVLRERRKVAALYGHTGVNYDFRQESCTLKTILFFFGLSYLSRFVWDIYVSSLLADK